MLSAVLLVLRISRSAAKADKISRLSVCSRKEWTGHARLNMRDGVLPHRSQSPHHGCSDAGAGSALAKVVDDHVDGRLRIGCLRDVQVADAAGSVPPDTASRPLRWLHG
jgi:hypothetical protein